MSTISSYQWQDGTCSMTLRLHSDDLVALFHGLELIGERVARRLPRQPRCEPLHWPEFDDFIEANGAMAEPLGRLQDLMLGLRAAAQDQALVLQSQNVRTP